MTISATAQDRDLTIAQIRKSLRARSGKAWSVKGGNGTAWGWIEIASPPARRVNGHMTEVERVELAELLSVSALSSEGASIPAGPDYRQEYLDRAAGVAPSVIGSPYWD